MSTRYEYNAQLSGVLGPKNPSPSQNGVFTHNPYWYEGFNPHALVCQPQSRFTYSEEMPPYPWSQQHYWEGWRPYRPMRTLRASNVKVQENFDCQRRFKLHSPPSSSDISSEQTIGYSDSERSDNEGRDSHLEAQLIQCILEYFGDCKGSLPSERVQNVIKKDHAELYEAVVVARFRKKWHKFLQHCSDTFHLFTRPAQPAPNQDYCWRIRLASNPDWEEADQQDEEYRSRRDKELLDKVHSILMSSPEKQCLMIDVINEMNKDVKAEDELVASSEGESQSRKARKIRAGDLKRLMRKCNSNFTILEFQDGENQKRATYMKLIEPNK